MLHEPSTHAKESALSPTPDGEDRGIPAISVSDLETRLANEHPLVLIDVREPFERDIADLPEVGQLRIPLNQIEDRMDEIDPDDAVVLYCRTGARSGWATQLLRSRGYEQAWNLEGGVMAWREEIDPSLEAY